MWPGGFFPTNPDLADILGRTDFDFEIFFLGLDGIPNFHMSRSQISKFPEIWVGPALGRALALGLGLSAGPGGPSMAGGSLGGWAPGGSLGRRRMSFV